MPMLTPFERLVEELGEEGARAEMRRRRSLVKKPGNANVSEKRKKEIMAKARAARKKPNEANGVFDER